MASAVDFQSLRRRRNERVRGVPYGDDDGVDIENKFAAFDGDRAAAAGRVRFAELVFKTFKTRYKTIVVPDDPLRILERKELDAFLLGVVNLFFSGRHFGFTPAIDEIDLVRAEAESHSARIHRDIASA